MAKFLKTHFILITFYFAFFITISSSVGDAGEIKKISTVLNGVKVSTWMYQLQWLDNNSHIDQLDDTEYDMMVVEPGFNFKEEPYDVKYLVSSLKEKPNGEERIVLAYIDIGQAEDYRTYWKKNWVAPTARKKGSPEFLITIDPDGWSGNYPVAYWQKAWQDLWLGKNGMIEKIAEYGFDGIYLDWVEAYDEDKISKAADSQNVDAENEMMHFIKKMRETGKAINPDFLVVPQNAPYLLDKNPVFYASIIDAIATEDTWFYGEGDAPWNSLGAGDLHG